MILHNSQHIPILKVATRNAAPADEGEDEAEDRYVPKKREEYTEQDHRVENLDRVARNIIQTTVSDGYLARIMEYKTAKEMWETLALISQGTEKIKENKLSIACPRKRMRKCSRFRKVSLEVQLRLVGYGIDAWAT